MTESKENTGSDLDRIGLFKEMSYHHEYIPLKNCFNDASKKGKQMMTNCTKTKAGNQDGFFNREFLRVFEGEAYIDTIRLNRLYRKEKAENNPKEKAENNPKEKAEKNPEEKAEKNSEEKAEKNPEEKAEKNLTPCFKYSSPTKKPTGKGSNYGTFGEYNKNKMEYFSSNPRDRVKSESSNRNIYVNPAQKGTGYGYPNLTIGKMPPYFLENEYEELKNTLRKPKKPQERSFPPYRAGIFQQGFFDPNPFKTNIDLPKEQTTSKEEEKKPFMPSSPTKKDGGMKAGCLNPFPQHSSEPYPKIDLVPRGVKMYKNDQKPMFRPVPGNRSYPIKSIINTNVQKQMNSTNFKTIKGVVYCKER